MKKELLKEYKAMAEKSTRSMENAVKIYLENLAATVPAFAEKYDPKKFQCCLKFIIDCAKEILSRKSGDVADDICYKMARDYFEDELWKEEKAKGKKDETVEDSEETEDAEEKAEKKATVDVVPEKKLQKPAPVPEQMDLFGGV